MSYVFKLYFQYTFFGTIFVNILGSFLIGYLVSLLQNKEYSEDIIKYFFIIGILGSFTTFSAFSFEVIDLLMSNKLFIAMSYIFLSLFACFIAAYIGLNINKI